MPTNQPTFDPRTPPDDATRVLRLIIGAGCEGIRRGKLRERSGMRAEQMDAIVAALMAAGRVSEEVINTGGRDARVYQEVRS